MSKNHNVEVRKEILQFTALLGLLKKKKKWSHGQLIFTASLVFIIKVKHFLLLATTHTYVYRFIAHSSHILLLPTHLTKRGIATKIAKHRFIPPTRRGHHPAQEPDISSVKFTQQGGESSAVKGEF